MPVKSAPLRSASLRESLRLLLTGARVALRGYQDAKAKKTPLRLSQKKKVLSHMPLKRVLRASKRYYSLFSQLHLPSHTSFLKPILSYLLTTPVAVKHCAMQSRISAHRKKRPYTHLAHSNSPKNTKALEDRSLD